MPCGEPLIRRQGLVPFAYRGGPSRSAMDDPGSGGDEAVLAAAFMFAAEPEQIPMPRVPGDDLNVGEEAGVPIVLSPPAHNRIEGPQTAILIHPGPGSGRQGFELLFDPYGPLRGWPEMDHPSPSGLDPLDMKAQEGEAFIHMGDSGFLLGQLEVECGLQVAFDRLLRGVDLGNPTIADDDKIISKPHQLIIAEACLPSLPSCVWRHVPLCGCPGVKLMEIGSKDGAWRHHWRTSRGSAKNCVKS